MMRNSSSRLASLDIEKLLRVGIKVLFMKATFLSFLTIVALGLAVAPLRAEPPPGSTTTTTQTTTTETSPGVWTTVPEDYEGNVYFYDNHYYHGGRYEPGDFTWEGKHYTGRYQHDGKWIYGGKWDRHEHHGKDRH